MDGKSDGFTLTLDARPSMDERGILAFDDKNPTPIEGNAGVSGYLWYDPVDADPEFLHAIWVGLDQATGQRIEKHCFLWDPSKSATLTAFSGAYATKGDDVWAYAFDGNMANIGKCTITLVR